MFLSRLFQSVDKKIYKIIILIIKTIKNNMIFIKLKSDLNAIDEI